MSLILSGTDGLSDIDGSAATPAIRGTDANTGIFFPAADTIAFAEGGVESMRLDSSGNLGLGVTPSAWGGQKAFQTEDASLSGRGNTADLMMNAYFDGSNYRYVRTFFASRYQQQDGNHRWAVAPSGTAGNAISFTQAMTLDATGNLLVGTTSFRGDGNGNITFLQWNSNTTNSGFLPRARFATNGTDVGFISTDGSGTTYSTSSDYRLKNTIAPMTGALAKVALLKPCTYKWNADNSESQGFIAHELQEVVPECVTGEKDAVDAEGNPVYQGIDTSFLVATLTAALQEAHGLITALTARVEALEGAQP